MMDWYRVKHTIRMYLCPSAIKRAEYLKKHDVFRHIGSNCMTMFRKIPLYPKLISLGNNVWIASGVLFVPHDVIHKMLNNMEKENYFQEFLGCIDIKDNVFIGSNTTILPNVTIGPDVVIAAGSLVNKSIRDGVFGGNPIRYICSLEDFIKKRNQYPNITINKQRRGGLSALTIEECWRRFEKSSNNL